MTYYTGMNPGDNPGNLPPPYYWWEAGAMFNALIDYWFYTGDETWNNITMQGMVWQAGSTGTFMPANQTMTEGNDDQVFWGFAAMSAAERNFPNPPTGQPQWLEMAQAVFIAMEGPLSARAVSALKDRCRAIGPASECCGRQAYAGVIDFRHREEWVRLSKKESDAS